MAGPKTHCPNPMPTWRLTNREINQSQELADAVLRLYDCPVAFGHAIGHNGILQADGSRRKVYGELHRKTAQHLMSGKRTSVLLPRGHGKSTLLQDIAWWDKWRDTSERAMYVSAATMLATQMLGEMQSMTKGDVELIPAHGKTPALTVAFRELFPELMPVKAPSGSPPGSFNVAGRRGTSREPCFFPSSIASNKAGLHPPKIYIDDVSNERNSTTPTQREKVIEALKQLEPIAGPNGVLRHIGTPWAFFCCSAWIAESAGWDQMRYGCWDGVNPDTGIADGQGPGTYALNPMYMTATELFETEQTIDDPEFWSQQYMVKPMAASYALFPDPVLNGAKQPLSDIDLLPDGKRILLWDPTGRANAVAGDWNGLVVVHVTTAHAVRHACAKTPALAIPGLADMPGDTNIFYPIHAEEIRGQPGDCLPAIEAIHERYKLNALWVEDTGQASLIRTWLHNKHWIVDDKVAIIPIKIGTRGASKDQRLQGIQVGMKEHRIRIPREFVGREVFLKRLGEFPKSESDDIPDAFALLTNFIMRRGKIPGVDNKDKTLYNPKADPLSLHFQQDTPPSAW